MCASVALANKHTHACSSRVQLGRTRRTMREKTRGAGRILDGGRRRRVLLPVVCLAYQLCSASSRATTLLHKVERYNACVCVCAQLALFAVKRSERDGGFVRLSNVERLGRRARVFSLCRRRSGSAVAFYRKPRFPIANTM